MEETSDGTMGFDNFFFDLFQVTGHRTFHHMLVEDLPNDRQTVFSLDMCGLKLVLIIAALADTTKCFLLGLGFVLNHIADSWADELNELFRRASETGHDLFLLTI